MPNPPISKIRDAVRKIALDALGPEIFKSVEIREAEGFLGEEILRVRIVIHHTKRKISGEVLFDILGKVTRALKRLGEPKRAILEYADIAEIEEIVDNQS